jgi:zinc protease
MRTWNVADYASPDTDYLQFLGALLAGDKNARLYKRLVIDEQLATRVNASVDNREIAGQFQIDVMVKPGVDLDRIEKIMDEELTKLIATGPSVAEIARVRTTTLAGFARSLERISQKASQLAESQAYLGSPDAWKAGYNRFRTANAADIQRVGRKWLTDGDYVLRILPFGELSAGAEGADRKAMPLPSSVAKATFPAVERATLSNGMKLVVAHRGGVPVVNLTVLLETGTPKDFASIPAGTGSIAMSLLDDGTRTRTREQIVEELGNLGATLRAGGGGETSSVSLSALKPALKASLAIFCDIIQNPLFAQTGLDRLKAQNIAGIAAAKQDPSRTAGRLLPLLMYGSDSAYGRMVTPETIQSVTRASVTAFHQRWFHPNNATLIVAGDTTLAAIRPMIEAAFVNWKQTPVPETIAPVSQPAKQTTVYLIDKPGTPQSVVQAALLAPARIEGDEVAREALNTALGGSFTSRLNMKLREEKGWAYGAHSGIRGGRGTRLFTAGTSVQTDKTAESITETAVLLKAITADHKIDALELATAKDNMALGLSSDWSTSDGVAGYLADEIASRLPDNYYVSYPDNVAAETVDQVNAAGGTLLANRPITWLVVGDLTKIEASIRKLNLGDVKVIDTDGNVVR